MEAGPDRKSTRLNSSHITIYTLSLHDALPISWLERLVAGVRRDERLVENERRILEPGVEIAVRPFVRRLAHRQAPLVVLGEVGRSPFQLLDRRRRWRLAQIGRAHV